MNKFLLLRKLCSVDMAVFEIVAHRNVDNWIQLLTVSSISIKTVRTD